MRSLSSTTNAHAERRHRRRWNGFTLVELVITVAIVGLLATVAIPLGQMATQRFKEAELRAALREVRTAIDAYKQAAAEGRIAVEADKTGYPTSLNDLVNGVEDARDANARKIFFLRRLPRDPFFPDPTVSAAETWGLRSYASPPTDPQPGEDVYDVHSLSKGVGLNGIAYRDW
jgi:general secretion pathway protein G